MAECGLWSSPEEERLPRQAIPAPARGCLFIKSSLIAGTGEETKNPEQPSPWAVAHMGGQGWQVGRVWKLCAPVGVPGSSQAHQMLTLGSHTHMSPHWGWDFL